MGGDRVSGSASAPELLTLHAVRLKGVADDRGVAERFALDQAATTELLLDYQAFGWITWSEFAGTGGWSLTDAGRVENERRLAIELDQAAGREWIRETYSEFLPLNERLQQACTDWQLRPTEADALAFNDHTDSQWDRRVIEELRSLGQALRTISNRISVVLDRFHGYDERFAAALAKVRAGDGTWVDRTGADSCHTVWFELHEDLIATLGIPRGAEVAGG
ncbi:transcriptional regulator [Kribbella sp. CA-293567]|uniref:transcriptional regulator n=1 Tax=Kribbella sp. CA-293567 TaxID=3002436 RepID=UPI0022DE124F|nr:transcriptional regulator [Kribbella sp. CA-293567]WBQ05557.1 transcriptional regulator [Kribbella sp. CA-293567]